MSTKSLLRTLILFTAVFAIGCAGFRETKVGHFYDNVTARYNGYFNAKEKVIGVQLATEEGHVDDFNQILDVLRLGDQKAVKANASEMDATIEKCKRVIQRHKGSDWVDNSYFVIAQSYFYKGEYYAALDLFKFLVSEYPETEVGYESELWVALCYLQIEKLDNAQAFIANALNRPELPDDLKTQAHLINAHVKIEMLNYSDAIKSLEKAIPETKGRKYQNRYIFILAQLYQKNANTRKAKEKYEIIENRNMPYEFLFQTRINIAKCSDLRRRSSAEKVIKSFRKLLKDDNNIDYFDQIYYEIAKVYQVMGEEALAVESYKQSAYFSKQNLNQKANTYLALGDIYFSNKEYVSAGAYYDSCANVIPNTHPQYSEIKNQQQVLTQLIDNLNTIKVQDSLQTIAKMTPEGIEKKIDEVIAYEKKLAEEAKAREELQKRREEIEKERGESSLDESQMRGTGSGDWYFYNSRAIGSGHTKFVSKWGNRKLEDDWRRSRKVSTGFNEMEEDTSFTEESIDSAKEETIFTEEIPIDLEKVEKNKLKYYQDLPFLPAQQKASDAKIVEALYGNGVIYYEKLANYPLSQESFEELLKRFAENKFELSAKYYLYKLHQLSGDTLKAAELKNYILTEHPTSEYAMLLSGNTKFAKNDKVNPELEKYYKSVYQEFQSGNCQSVNSMSTKADTLFASNYLKPNFDFLRTVCNGRSGPRPEFISSLQALITTYPGHSVSKDAQNIIRYYGQQDAEKEKAKQDSVKRVQDSLKKYASPKNVEKFNETLDIPYVYTEDGQFIYLVVVDLESVKPREINQKFSDFNFKYHRGKDLSVQSYVLNKEEHVIAIMGIKDIRTAVGYHKGLVTDDEFIRTNALDGARMSFISRNNFKLLIKAKSENEYMQFFELNYAAVLE